MGSGRQAGAHWSRPLFRQGLEAELVAPAVVNLIEGDWAKKAKAVPTAITKKASM
jgi:hypothetical protein